MWFQGSDVNFRFQLDPAFLQGFKAGEGFVLGMRGRIGTAQGGGNVTFLFYLKDNWNILFPQALEVFQARLEQPGLVCPSKSGVG